MFAAMWIDLEIIMQVKLSQEKDKYHMVSSVESKL